MWGNEAMDRVTQNRAVAFWVVIALLFSVNLLLESPSLAPTLQELNPHDEVKYIDSGRSFVMGSLRGFEWSPMSTFVYAPIYLLVQGSADWLIWAAAVGRHLLFGLLWLTFFLLGRRFSGEFSIFVFLGIVLVASSFTEIVKNPSDALFAAASAVALERTLAYEEEGRLSHVWLGSVFIGLAALARNDGLLLFPVFVVVMGFLGMSSGQGRRALLASVAPALAVVAGYSLWATLEGEALQLGTGTRGLSAYIWSLRNNFGYTQTELNAALGVANGGPLSLLEAVTRNPALFLEQVQFNLFHTPQSILRTYGKRIGPLLFLLALTGAYSLWRRGQHFRLALLIVWPLHSLIYLAFYLRPGFFLLDHYVLFVLAAAGVSFLIGDFRSTEQRILLIAPFLALGLYGALDGKPAFLATGALISLAFVLGWLAMSGRVGSPLPASGAMLILLAAALILRSGYPFPNYSQFGSTAMDRAVHFLQENFDRGNRLVADAPLVPIAARMTHVDWGELLRSSDSEKSDCELLQGMDIAALYVTPDSIRRQPRMQSFLQRVEGTCVHRALVADPGSIEIFLVAEDDS